MAAYTSQVALQSVAKRASNPDPGPNDEPAKPAAPPKDYSLKEGQTFSIKLPGREGKKTTPPTSSSGSSGSGGGLFALPPPPPPGRRR